MSIKMMRFNMYFVTQKGQSSMYGKDNALRVGGCKFKILKKQFLIDIK